MSAGASDGPRESSPPPGQAHRAAIVRRGASPPPCPWGARGAAAWVAWSPSQGPCSFSCRGAAAFASESQTPTCPWGSCSGVQGKAATGSNRPPRARSAQTAGLFNTLQLLIKFLSRRISSRLTDCYYSPSELLIPASKFCQSLKSSRGRSVWGAKVAACSAGMESASLQAVSVKK